jgi:phage terminase large subunit-like protein
MNPKLPQLLSDARAAGWDKWIRNEADERAVLNGCTFDTAAAEHVVEFFRRFLRHSKGEFAGTRFVPTDWQRDDIFFPLFGWKRNDGTRRYRKAYVEIPKKNGKSTLASGVGLYMLTGDGEPGAEVYSAATDQKQAGIVHGEAVHMVDASPALTKALKINRSSSTISHAKSRSVYRALSAEAAGKEGLNAHCILADELHVWYGRKLWDALKYAFSARRQGLLFIITTAGDDMTSVCREEHDYAQSIIKGTVFNDRYLAYIRAAAVGTADKPGDDLEKVETWRKSNPSMGVTIIESDFAAELEEAKKSPASWSTFKRYRFNIWASGTNPWLNQDAWEKCKATFTAEDLRGRDCYSGLDLSKTQDMTALLLVFPPIGDEVDWRLLPFFWLPHATAFDPDQLNPYRGWAEADEKFLDVTPGDVCDYNYITKRIAELKELFTFRELAYDPYNAEQLTQDLADNHAIPRIAFPQTIQNFASPTAEFERLVIAGRMRHNGHPILSWQAGHVQVKSDANNNKRPVKPAHGDRRKIDGIVAAIMALGRAIGGEGGPSVLESRGPIVLGGSAADRSAIA